MRRQKVDFWGLNYIKGTILDYLESYFLVFQNKKVINELYSFFKHYNDEMIETVQDVCACFEVGLFQHLKSKGYSFGSYRNTDNYHVYRDPDICLIQYGLPIVKRKSFQEPYYDKKKIGNVLDYLDKKKSPLREFFVETELLPESFDKEVYKEIPITLSEEHLLDFVERNKEIYIFGAGLVARKIWYMYHGFFYDYKGFIVSDLSSDCAQTVYGYPVYEYKNLKNGKAIIIGLNHKNTMDVKNSIKNTDSYITLWDL